MKLIRFVIAGLLLPIGAVTLAAETPTTGTPTQKAADAGNARSAKEQLPPPVNDKSPSSSAHKKHNAGASKNHKKINPPEPDKRKSKKSNPPEPDKKKVNPPEPDKASPAK